MNFMKRFLAKIEIKGGILAPRRIKVLLLFILDFFALLISLSYFSKMLTKRLIQKICQIPNLGAIIK